MFTSYRRILLAPGALRMSLAALIARLPMAMAELGIVLLVTGATGRYELAGAISAAYIVASAAMAILQGRLLDRLGQPLVLSVASLGFGGSMTLMVVSVQASWPLLTTFAFAATGGALMPQIGSAIRARWSHLLDQATGLHTAFALEAVLDEALFIAGPILATALATAWHPAAGIAVAIAACVAGTLACSAQPSTAPPPRPREAATGPAMPWRTVLPLAVVFAALGVLFGAAEITTVAFAEEHGNKAAAGWLLAVWAAGSLAAGLATGAIGWRHGPARRVRWGAVAMTAAMVPLCFVGSLPVMGAVLLIGGVSIAPTMIAGTSLTEAMVPASRLTEGMAIMHTGLLGGVAPGAAFSGMV
ncbi:MAG: MFS transporter, partial [Nocardiopsaceae bacterium]|nr:MFS transporter [Nocardiopsaceae bacterium]